SIVANSISLKKYEAIKIIFIRVDPLTRKTFGLKIILGRGLLNWCVTLWLTHPTGLFQLIWCIRKML
ncbi:hypothetical protein, partial [Microcystis aeruginosa]|uniref:hypothetical protein n=1 Tax=Microcystis aeruginosa TaxID=1126 RepID=UPI001C104710